MNSEILPLFLGGKLPRLDVHATFNDGEKAILEMQTSKSNDDLKRRAEYNTALLFASQEARGKQYREIKRVYQIFFLDFELFPKSDKLIRRYTYREESEQDRLSDGTEIIFYELPKLERRFTELLKENLTDEEKWCIFIKYQHDIRAKELINRLCNEEKGIMKAKVQVEKVSRSMIRTARRIAAIKDELERNTEMAIAREQAQKEGFQDGIEKGIEKGKEKGIEKGREEERFEIARNMKKANESIEKISLFTGLSSEEINNL